MAGCGRPIVNFGYAVTGEPLKCGTKLFWTTAHETVFCQPCTETQAAEEAVRVAEEEATRPRT